MEEKFKNVDELFEKWDTTKSPGCALAVVKNGEILYKKGYGMATLEHSATIQPSTRFYIASTSKQFAAFQIALLEEAGLLSAEDDVREYIPELPDYGSTIRILHLIHHISGLRDFLELNALSGRHYDELITPEDALEMICRQKQLNFNTGDRYLYCNSGYFLLSEIVKRVSGKSMRQFAEENIFGPLGMKDTHFHDDRTEPISRRAVGYRLDREKGYRISVPGLETVGSGGIYSTVEDLALWDKNFYNNRLGKGSPQLMERILVRGVLNDGEELDYAFGLTVQDYKGVKKIGHSGGYGGYSAEFIRFPEHAFTIICLSNNSTLSAPSLALKVADIFLEEHYKKQETSETEELRPVELDIKGLKQKTGYYFSDESEVVLKMEVKDNKLGLDFQDSFFPLTPVSDNHFHLLNAPLRAEIEFLEGDKTRIAKVDLKRGKEPECLQQMQERKLPEAEIEALVGEYYSDELGTYAKIDSAADGLTLKLGRHLGEMIPGENDQFIIEGDVLSRAILTVEAGQDQAYRFYLNSGRVRNIRFDKK